MLPKTRPSGKFLTRTIKLMDAARETLDLAQDAKRHSMQRIVREFLAWCRRDGFYAFEVSGETFLLETEADEETIFEAIYASSPAVIRYREAQAMRYLPNAGTERTAADK